MSYEAKYNKYKQKYLDLKNKIALLEQAGGVENNVENNNVVPNDTQQNVETTEFNLSETPTNEQSGGYSVGQGASVGNMSGVPNAATCAGSVNPQPSTAPPVMPQNTQAVVPPGTAPLASANNKNLVESEEATTTDLKSDVEQIFNQLGGDEHYDPFSDSNDSLSSSDLGDSSDDSESPSDMDAVYSPIASDTLPPGKSAAGVRTGLGVNDDEPFGFS